MGDHVLVQVFDAMEDALGPDLDLVLCNLVSLVCFLPEELLKCS